MKATVLFVFTFLGIASAGRLGHHDTSHGHSQNSGHFVPSTGQGVAQTSPPQLGLIRMSTSGIIIFDGYSQAGIFRNGELTLIGRLLAVGENEDFTILSATATLSTGETVFVDSGLVNARSVASTDTRALIAALSSAGITLDQFIQQTGTIPPQQGVFVVTAGSMTINGVSRNVRGGVFIIVAVNGGTGPVTGAGIGSGIGSGTGSGIGSGTGAGNLAQTVTVTETAVFETRTVVEPVTLIKTQTIDQFETVTAPNYASILVSVTDIVKQTVTVTEEEVIRSTGAGSLVVNTVPVPSETVLNVQARTTNFFVRTVTDQVSLPQTHFVTIHSIRTNTVNNPATSTITQVITQTRVSTVYKTSVVGSTIYTTSTTIITIGTGGGSTTVPAGYY